MSDGSSASKKAARTLDRIAALRHSCIWPRRPHPGAAPIRMPTTRRHPLHWLPNAITLLRAAAIPVVAFALLRRDYDGALLLVVLCALGDFVDGWLARALDVRTRFGAIADPLADKLTMLTVATLLAWQGWLPVWFAALIVLRDVLIVGGALAYHLHVGHVAIAPSWLSKLNTALEFVLLAAILLVAEGVLAADGAVRVLMLVCTATILASGAHYVLTWGRKALRARHGKHLLM
jgi:cardiolipin synthase